MTTSNFRKVFSCRRSVRTKNGEVRTRGLEMENDDSISYKIQDDKKNEPPMEPPKGLKLAKERSIFFSCREFLDEFDEDTKEGFFELEKSGIFDLTVFQDAIGEDLCRPIAVEQDDNMHTLDYAPATIRIPHKSSDTTLENPKTLLFEGNDTHEDLTQRQPSFSIRGSTIIKGALEAPATKMSIPGYPGQLSTQELNACMELRKFLAQESNKEMREMALALYGIETDEYALCRRLRARHFVVEDVIQHLKEGVDIWKEGKDANFYPSARDALGADPSIVLSLFPYMYSGFAKNGCPVLYFKGGQTNMEGLECVMDVSNMEKYAWHMFMFMFKDVVRESMKKNGLVRTEQIVIIDLKNLSSKSIAASARLLKMFSRVGTCFPELMNRSIIINAPPFFAFAWKMLKTFLDERTKNKISLSSNYKKGTEKLKELIEDDQLLSDYNGSAPSFEEVMQSKGDSGANVYTRQIMQVLSKDKKSMELKLNDKEECEVTVYTKSTSGAQFTVLANSNICGSTLQMKNPDTLRGDKVQSYNMVISRSLKGPQVYTIDAKPISSARMDNFLVVGRVR